MPWEFFLFLKSIFSVAEQARIVEAIRVAEKETSGEIRIYVESKNPFMDPLDRAAEIFIKLKMQDTADRNAVLLYIAMKDHELALFGDEGIHQKVGAEYWNMGVKKMITQFADQHIVDGIEQCISQIGQTLKETFPYEATTDKNELPDDLVFGK
ncbi:MAG: TPM domain-containing protein [Ferruginibacter sp.]